MTEVDLRLIRFLDAFSMSLRILDCAYSDLHATCARLPNDRNHLPAALWRCWSFIDTVHRLREMAQAVPGLAKRSRERARFLADTAIAEGFRHYIQHLRRELSKRELDPFPVWGSLSWVDPNDDQVSHLAVAGALTRETKLTGCVFDRVNGSWVSKVCLGVAGLSFNFDPIHSSCHTFGDFIVPRLTDSLRGLIEVKPVLPVVSMCLTNVKRGDAFYEGPPVK